jgi:Flp pilus assembly protein TadG
MHALAQHEDGATLVEWALIAPILFILIFAVIDSSAILFARSTLTHAAREGARYGATHSGDPAGIAAVVADAASLLDADALQINVSSGSQTIQVEVRYTAESATGLVFPAIDLTAVSTMQIE